MVALVPIAAAAGAVVGYKGSQKYGSKIPYGNAGKAGLGLALVVGAHWVPQEHAKAFVLGVGAGVAADGLLSMAGL